jgi:type II secretory pathway pseudopilin PulG
VNRRRRQRAFTLIELLLAVMVTVMISVSTVAMIRSTDQTRRRVDRQMALQQETRAAVETITAALRNAARTEDQSNIFEGYDADLDGLPADRVKFLTISPLTVRRDQPESDVKECEFFLQPSPMGRPPMLMQRLDPTRNDEPDGGGVVRCIAQNIIVLELAYHNGLSWQDGWSVETDGWPVAIRVNLLAVDPDDVNTTWPVESIVNFPRMPEIRTDTQNQQQNREGQP